MQSQLQWLNFEEKKHDAKQPKLPLCRNWPNATARHKKPWFLLLPKLAHAHHFFFLLFFRNFLEIFFTHLGFFSFRGLLTPIRERWDCTLPFLNFEFHIISHHFPYDFPLFSIVLDSIWFSIISHRHQTFSLTRLLHHPQCQAYLLRPQCSLPCLPEKNLFLCHAILQRLGRYANYA